MSEARECMWCSRIFTPRATGQNHYALPSAGTYICWSCSDLYQEAEVKLHFGSMRARMLDQGFVTETGHRLSLTLQSWKTSRKPWARQRGNAQDIYGKLWSVSTKNDYFTLKPIGV